MSEAQELTAAAAAAREAAAASEAETARVRSKSEDIQRKVRGPSCPVACI